MGWLPEDQLFAVATQTMEDHLGQGTSTQESQAPRGRDPPKHEAGWGTQETHEGRSARTVAPRLQPRRARRVPRAVEHTGVGPATGHLPAQSRSLMTLTMHGAGLGGVPHPGIPWSHPGQGQAMIFLAQASPGKRMRYQAKGYGPLIRLSWRAGVNPRTPKGMDNAGRSRRSIGWHASS